VLTAIHNFALVQFIQVIIFIFFIVLSVVIVSVRLHLPKTKIEPVIDIVMVFTIFVYAVVLRIIFST